MAHQLTLKAVGAACKVILDFDIVRTTSAKMLEAMLTSARNGAPVRVDSWCSS